MDYLRGVFGLAVIVLVAFIFSSNRKKIDWRLVGIGILLQLVFGFLITQVPVVESAFAMVSRGFVKFLSFSRDGAAFIFGDLAGDSYGFIFAFQVLPTIIFFSTVSAGLYYLGILQKVVFGIAWVMARTMRLSGPESLSAAGNIFLGQTEAPLLVRPFIPQMSKSELMCLMTGGMATIAGGVLAGYVAFLGGDSLEEQSRFAAYLLGASIMNAPAAIVMSKMFIPEVEKERVQDKLEVNEEAMGVNLIDAMSIGASEGLKLALNVGAMLLAFIAVIAAVNYLLMGILGDVTGLNEFVVRTTGGQFQGFSLEYLFGQVFRVFAWVIGVEWADTLQVGSLLGQKTVINEFVAYLSLSEMKEMGSLSAKSIVIATYALCGFSNFSSIAIQLGGIAIIAPNQQANISRLGLKSLLAASLACLMTATIAGMLFG
ncbi:NupC/NupG family nucleoside CNT transporter [Algoriphagus winogradskyi]|uniref:Concentrative nucleoside transporter, CNT family n=1 Tax=Algoriphagus winogradskyi TaxID=237017 RepID=A0ABY1N8L0_9BACT|nr:nucleoside transporter C-terminal domain-containing protein [Algoriphagus winogradskyi]SMP02956.1 concentrative nucleoside transporter, CNT family [Algoriphagus winogradskyi]|tara:strand:- start:4051 stop:5337 length:1287 start_codon:yes stop_codon:yes gene_type:complete